jgi:hypothetical protein
MPASHLTPRRVLAVALLAACGAAPFAGSAVADENPFPFALAIKPNAQLLPVLHATEAVGSPEDGREYDYVTKGYFKVAGKTVARLPSFSGHADRTREHLRLAVKRSTRSTIRAVAKRHGTRRVILTLVHRITLTTNIPGDMAPHTQTVTQDAFLQIPRSSSQRLTTCT